MPLASIKEVSHREELRVRCSSKRGKREDRKYTHIRDVGDLAWKDLCPALLCLYLVTML